MFEHFLAAQEKIYPDVLAELAAGQKRSHWIWFIFPQLAALGRSATAQRFGLAGLADAAAYAAHPVLGARLRECFGLACAIAHKSAREVFGFPDELKVRSSATLFLAATQEPLFQAALDRFYAGRPDPLTLAALER